MIYTHLVLEEKEEKEEDWISVPMWLPSIPSVGTIICCDSGSILCDPRMDEESKDVEVRPNLSSEMTPCFVTLTVEKRS